MSFYPILHIPNTVKHMRIIMIQKHVSKHPRIAELAAAETGIDFPQSRRGKEERGELSAEHS